MLDVPFLSTSADADAPVASPAGLATAFFVQHGDALAHAAELLGGRWWWGRWCRLSGDLRRGCLSPGQIRRELAAFLSLLRLEGVGDPDREETALFAALHPDSPEVHELCRLTDALAQLLDAFDEAVALARHASPATGAVLVRQGPPGRAGVRRLAAPRWQSRPAARARAQRHAPASAPPLGGA